MGQKRAESPLLLAPPGFLCVAEEEKQRWASVVCGAAGSFPACLYSVIAAAAAAFMGQQPSARLPVSGVALARICA